MFRLIKLAVYILAGYAAYEFYLGLTEVHGAGQQGPSKRPNRSRSEPNSLHGRKKIPVGDGSGAERMQTVGRGVVS